MASSGRNPGRRQGRGGRGPGRTRGRGAPSREQEGRRPRRPSRYLRTGTSTYYRSARYRLRRFRTGSALAIALTALLLLLTGESADGQDPAQDTILPDTVVVLPLDDSLSPDTALSAADTGDLGQNVAVEASRSLQEVRSTIREITIGISGLLPKIVIALVLLALAAATTRLIRPVLRHAFGTWEKADAAAAASTILLWFLALAIALSVVAGSPRALLGSIGLFGLALSWALQAPIESFTAWLLNSFKGYYRVGDRIGVGDVFGDVYRIDFLNTTVWEAGGPDKPVQGAQPTGALITFPNSELLRANVVNYTRDFPYVWDEVTVGISDDSDVEYAMRVAVSTAKGIVGDAMQKPIETYRGLLETSGLGMDIADQPQVYVAGVEQWFELTVRYLVPVRERRRWASTLTLELQRAMTAPEHADRIRAAYPVRQMIMRSDDAQ